MQGRNLQSQSFTSWTCILGSDHQVIDRFILTHKARDALGRGFTLIDRSLPLLELHSKYVWTPVGRMQKSQDGDGKTGEPDAS